VTQLKVAARSAMRACATAVGSTRIGSVLIESTLESAMRRTRSVSHRGTRLLFSVPNRLNQVRVQTFSTKEPETLAWIDSIPEGATVWDIGANVGLYSCYAAKARRCRVIAFEPSVFNVELLARNVALNTLCDRVTIFPLPLFQNLVESTLNMTTTAWGGALSSFGTSLGFDGREMAKVFEVRTIGLSMDECVAKLNLAPPQYVKMDVDGIENLILRGGTETLRGVRSISIEINDAFAAQASDCSGLLASAGLHLMSKAHSEMIDSNPKFNMTFNQVWVR
jgi:FkbM family methyltransferase